MHDLSTMTARLSEHAKGMTRRQLEEEYIKLQGAAIRAEFTAIEQAQVAASAAKREAAEKAQREREAERAAKIENLRQGCWLNVIDERMRAQNPDVLFVDVCDQAKRETPATGWPPGHDVTDYAIGSVGIDLEPAADVRETHLGKLAAERNYRT